MSKKVAVVAAAMQALCDHGLATPADFEGICPATLHKLEADAGMRFPQVYAAFLLAMGRRGGEFLIGTDWTEPALPTLKGNAISLLHEGGLDSSVLPKNAWVFAMHQGYQLLFFDADAGPDPAVYHFLEGDAAPRKVFDSFSEWLTVCVADEVKAHERFLALRQANAESERSGRTQR